MIDHLGIGRLFVLLVVALVVFGPDRLPEVAAQAGRALRHIKELVSSMGSEVRASVGPELAGLDLASLHPRTFLTGLMADETPSATAEVATSAAPAVEAPRLFPLPAGSDAMALLRAPLDLETDLLTEHSAAAQPL